MSSTSASDANTERLFDQRLLDQTMVNRPDRVGFFAEVCPSSWINHDFLPLFAECVNAHGQSFGRRPRSAFDTWWVKHENGECVGIAGSFGANYCCRSDRGMGVAMVSEFPMFRTLQIHRMFRERLISRMMNEMDVMQTISELHPNIAKVKAVYNDQRYLRVVREGCKGSTLFDKLSEQGRFTEEQASKITRQIIEGLRFMHEEHGIVHNDLTLHSILMDEGKEDPSVKITGFGMSNISPTLKFISHLSCVPYFTAPEIIVPATQVRKPSQGADVWSVGVILFTLLFGCPPFVTDPFLHPGKEGAKTVYRRICRGMTFEVMSANEHGWGAFFPSEIPVSESCMDLIKHLLQSDVTRRYTESEVITHPWFEQPFERDVTRATVSSERRDPICVKFIRGCQLRESLAMLFRQPWMESTPRDWAELEDVLHGLDEGKTRCVSVSQLIGALKGIPVLSRKKDAMDALFGRLVSEESAVRISEVMRAMVHEYLLCCDDILHGLFLELDEYEGRVNMNELRSKLKGMGLGWMCERDRLRRMDGRVFLEELRLLSTDHIQSIPESIPHLGRMRCGMQEREKIQDRERVSRVKSRLKGLLGLGRSW